MKKQYYKLAPIAALLITINYTCTQKISNPYSETFLTSIPVNYFIVVDNDTVYYQNSSNYISALLYDSIQYQTDYKYTGTFTVSNTCVGQFNVYDSQSIMSLPEQIERAAIHCYQKSQTPIFSISLKNDKIFISSLSSQIQEINEINVFVK